jgi:phosphoglycerol transferase MdoB-like AlkP superfamily enzyme
MMSDEGFGEDKSVYSSIYNGSTEFDYDTAWNNILIVPNREMGQSAEITELKIYYDSLCILSMNASDIAEGCENIDEDYINYNGSTLTVTASEATPYPALRFNEDFLQRFGAVKKLVIATDLFLALFATLIIYAVLVLAYTLVKRSNRLCGYISKNRRLVLFNVLTFVMLFASLRHFNGFNIVVDYDNDLSGELSTTYYDYDGNGFKEINSTYSTVEGKTGNNRFYIASDVDALSLIPNRAVNKKAYIKSITVYEEGLKLKTYTPRALVDYYIDNPSENIYIDGDMLVVETTEAKPYPQINLNGYFLNEVNSLNATVLATDVAKAVILYALLALSVLAYKLGKAKRERFEGKEKKAGIIVCIAVAVLFAACWFISVKALAYMLAVVGVPLVLFAVGAFKLPLFGKKEGYSAVAFFIAETMLMTAQTSVFYPAEFFVYAFWNMCLYALMSLCYVAVTLYLKGEAEAEDSKLNDIAGWFVKIVAAVLIYEFVKTSKLYEYNSLIYCFELILSNILQLNIMWLLLALCATYGLLGKGITNTLWGIIGFIVIVGNAVKISYHGTMLTPADFMQIKDMLAIAPDVIGVAQFYAIIAIIIIAVVVLALNIKRILPHLKPRLSIYVLIVSAVVLVGFNYKIVSGAFESINLCDKPYIDEVTNEKTNGVAVYNMFKVKHIPDMRMKKPDDYTEDNVNKLIAEFDSLKTDGDDVKPNVICILAESYFDLNSVSDFTFSEDIIPTTRSIGISNMVSPRYGGYTAAVEYEVLTGNSLAFYPPAVIPYTAYFTNAKRSIPSVPMEFADNGYKTYAIHPNTANFYNRDKAYEMMGFDEYYAISSFADAPMTKNSFVKDIAVADKIISTIEDNDEPVFTFGITLESHYTDAQRFDETEIKVSSDTVDLTENEINDLEQQAQSYRELDNMIAYLKDYIDNSDEPTILYIFGDHLPPVSAFGKSSYVQDVNNKYRTISLAYSNYKEVGLKDMATPNFIAAQMLVDSGVEHSSYFDYLYKLKDSMPIIHKEFTDMDTTENEDLEKYYMIQYDIMFGEQWFYKNDK